MDEKNTDRVVSASLDYFGQNAFFGVLVLVVGWVLGWVLGFAISKSIESENGKAACRRLCPIIGVVAAFPLAYKLLFSA